jgi:hypothetical protein
MLDACLLFLYIVSTIVEALKDNKLGVITQPRLNTLLKTELHHMAVASWNRIWDQRWAMINHLQLEDAKELPCDTPTYWSSPEHHEKYNQEQKIELKKTRRQCQQFIITTAAPQTGSGVTLEFTPCRLLGPTGMVGARRGDLLSHTPTFINVQPSVTTHSLTHSHHCTAPEIHPAAQQPQYHVCELRTFHNRIPFSVPYLAYINDAISPELPRMEAVSKTLRTEKVPLRLISKAFYL